ncbi:hypothetical protein BDW69DRAFT_183630 [Aspergillus filifer]
MSILRAASPVDLEGEWFPKRASAVPTRHDQNKRVPEHLQVQTPQKAPPTPWIEAQLRKERLFEDIPSVFDFIPPFSTFSTQLQLYGRGCLTARPGFHSSRSVRSPVDETATLATLAPRATDTSYTDFNKNIFTIWKRWDICDRWLIDYLGRLPTRSNTPPVEPPTLLAHRRKILRAATRCFPHLF